MKMPVSKSLRCSSSSAYSENFYLKFYWWTVWESLASVARSLQPLVDGLGNPMHMQPVLCNHWWTVWEMKGFVTRNMYMKISQLRKILVRISLQLTEKLYDANIEQNFILQFNILNPAIPSVRYSISIFSICEQILAQLILRTFT